MHAERSNERGPPLNKYVMIPILLATAVAIGLPQGAEVKGASIRVQIHYTGKGEVNQGHKIFVALWDSPGFAEPNAKVTPVAVKWVASKNGIVTFSDVKKMPVYVSCAYDPAGKWDSRSAPPDDASVGLYGNSAMQPVPVNVAARQSTKVQIQFDDSIKMR